MVSDALRELIAQRARYGCGADHFVWTADGLRILGTTPVGRATCLRLDINDESRGNPFIQTSRRVWIEMGLHPPEEDPRLASELGNDVSGEVG